MNKYFVTSGLLLLFAGLFLLNGCTETGNFTLPYTSSQFIAQTTDLNYYGFVAGLYDGNCLSVDGNKITVTDCLSVDANIPWDTLIDFPSGCEAGQAVKIVGSSLVCIDLPIDTNFGTAGFNADDINNSLIDLTGYVPYTGATTNVDLGANNLITNYLNIYETSGDWTRMGKIGIGSTTAGYGGYFEFPSSTSDGYGPQIGGVRNDDGSGKGDFIIKTGGNSQSERFRIYDDGHSVFTHDLTANNLSGTNTGDQNLEEYLPYKNANQDVNLGSHNLDSNGYGRFDGGIIARGDSNTYELPSGVGTRLMWIPNKSAFRSGYVLNDNWDYSNIGEYSFAVGQNPKASGTGAVALGYYAEATGSSSISLGTNAEATSSNAVAIGQGAKVTNNTNAVAIGNDARASGLYAVSIGGSTRASGAYSVAYGYSATATNMATTSLGNGADATGNNAVALGKDNLASGTYSVAIGNTVRATGLYNQAFGRSFTNSNAYTLAFGYSEYSMDINADAIKTYRTKTIITPDTDTLIVSGSGDGSGIDGPYELSFCDGDYCEYYNFDDDMVLFYDATSGSEYGAITDSGYGTTYYETTNANILLGWGTNAGSSPAPSVAYDSTNSYVQVPNVIITDSTITIPNIVMANSDKNITFYNSDGNEYANLNAGSFNVFSPSDKEYSQDKLDLLVEPDKILNVDGKIDSTTSFKNEVTSATMLDLTKPIYTDKEDIYCYSEITKDGNIKEICDKIIRKMIIGYENKEEDKLDMSEVLFNNRLLISELKEKNLALEENISKMKEELCLISDKYTWCK